MHNKQVAGILYIQYRYVFKVQNLRYVVLDNFVFAARLIDVYLNWIEVDACT